MAGWMLKVDRKVGLVRSKFLVLKTNYMVISDGGPIQLEDDWSMNENAYWTDYF